PPSSPLFPYTTLFRSLVDNPRVSQFRLTAHLGIAFLIYAAMLRIAFDLLFARAGAVSRRLRRFASALAALVFVMALSGGLVAGTDRKSTRLNSSHLGI